MMPKKMLNGKTSYGFTLGKQAKRFYIILTMLFLASLQFRIALVSSDVEENVTEVSGIISKDTTWSGNTLVTEKVTVAEGVTLAVEPGTVVKFKHWRPGCTEPFRRIQLTIEGTLLAVGTPEKLIRFTSDALEPEHSDWMGINFGPSSKDSVIDYSIVEFAKGCGIGVYHANITLSNSIVRWCQGANVWLDHSTAIITRNRIYGAGHGGIEMAYSNPTITYNTIWNNGLGIVPISTSDPTIYHNIIIDNRFIGLLIMGCSSPLIEYNNITGNTYEGIKIHTSNAAIRYNNIYNNGAPQLLLEHQGDITATNNWWGTADKEEVKSSIQVREGSISYEPYLTSPADIGEVKYDYENNETYDHPPATENDIFPYFYPSDKMRKIVSYWSTVNNPSGIVWDGEYFWVVNLDKKLLKYDPSGKLIDSLTAPGSLPIALAYDGQYLWTLDFSEQRAYQFDFSGRVIKSISAPVGGYGEGGLAYDGHYLWTGQGDKLYKFDIAGNIVEVIQIQMDRIVISGLAWDGEHLWAVDKEVNEKIFEVDPSSGSILRWINPPGDETWGMTWVDGYLWACEWTNDWNNYLIVKMEPTTPVTTTLSITSISVSGELTLLDEDFSDGKAEGWEFLVEEQGAGWSVAREDNSYVLQGAGHAFAFAGEPSWSPASLEVKVKLLSGGLHVNVMSNPPLRYIVGVGENNLALRKERGPGDFITLAQERATITLNDWFTVRIDFEGQNITVYVNNEPKIKFTDVTPLSSGRISFETSPVSQAMIDGVKVSGVVPSTVFNASIKFVNTGSVTAKNVSASIILPEGLQLSAGTRAVSIGDLAAGEDRTIMWSLKAENDRVNSFEVMINGENLKEISTGRVVAVKRPSTTLTMNFPSTVTQGKPITITATLKDDRGSPVQGAIIDFLISTTKIDSATTAGDGTASISYTPHETRTFQLKATFNGTINYAESSSTIGILTVQLDYTPYIIGAVAAAITAGVLAIALKKKKSMTSRFSH